VKSGKSKERKGVFGTKKAWGRARELRTPAQPGGETGRDKTEKISKNEEPLGESCPHAVTYRCMKEKKRTGKPSRKGVIMEGAHEEEKEQE